MRFLPLHGSPILRSLLFHLNPLGIQSPPRSPPRTTRPPHRVHPPPRGSTRTMTVPLKRVSLSIRLGCGLPKHARSAGAGKLRSVVTLIIPTVFAFNEMDSATANHLASGARTEGWSVNMLASAECVGRTKSRARTVIRTKFPPIPLANRRSFHQLSPTIANTSICIFQPPFSPLIEDSVPDKSANDNLGLNNRHRIPLSVIALPARIHWSACTTEFFCLFLKAHHSFRIP